LAGIAVAMAYNVRYTQVLVAPGLLLSAWAGLRGWKRRLTFCGAFVAAAGLGALPDVIYRTALYGAPWRFGTGELALFSPRALPTALARVGPELLKAGEWGWLWPLAVIGAIVAWRRSRRALAVMAAAYGPPLVFHAWYPFLRLRDVLWVYAPLAALTALGGAAALAWLWRLGRRRWVLRAGLVGGLLLLAGARAAPLL
jgi:MYXO-CTERM domain-containing protein